MFYTISTVQKFVLNFTLTMRYKLNFKGWGMFEKEKRG